MGQWLKLAPFLGAEAGAVLGIGGPWAFAGLYNWATQAAKLVQAISLRKALSVRPRAR